MAVTPDPRPSATGPLRPAASSGGSVVGACECQATVHQLSSSEQYAVHATASLISAKLIESRASMSCAIVCLLDFHHDIEEANRS